MTKGEAILVLDSLSTWLGHERPITEEIVEAIKTISRPSIPSNLDEVAEEYRNFREECGIKDPVMLNEIEEAYYAGAEYQLNKDSKKHYFIQLKNIKDAWQELKKVNPEIENKPAVCFHRGAEWMLGQFQKIDGDLVDWYSTSDGKEYCCGVKTNDTFEVPEGFYIKKK